MNRPRLLLPLISFLALAVIFACGQKAPNPITDHGSPYFDNLEAAKLAASIDKRPILLDFYTDW